MQQDFEASAETTSADDSVETDADRLRSWYKEAVDQNPPPEEEETIGLLGGRSRSQDGDLGAHARTVRLAEMLNIVRKYDILHGLSPKTLRRMLEELGPTFVKAGQILSMRSEILPESFCQELGKLRSEVEPMSREIMLDTLRAEYTIPLEQIFESIDDTPLGSASVAQVHKARLVTGEDVAVKIQRPNVRQVMAQDISIMRTIARNANRIVGDSQFIDIQSVVEELWQSFREETDFMIEAHALAEFRRNNASCAFVTCPKPYMGLCTPHVVVMDYVKGIPISKINALQEAGYDLEEIGIKLIDNYAGQMLDDGFFHADPHPGNIVISGGKITYLDLGIMGRLSAHDRNTISDIVFAVVDLDTPRLKEALIRFSISDEQTSIQHSQLLADLDTVVQDYGTTSLSELDVAQLLNSIIRLARRNNIELPSSITLLGRSLVTVEGTVNDLLANESIVDILAQHVRAHMSKRDIAQNEMETLAREARLATHGVLQAAAQAPLALNMLTRGQLLVNATIPGSLDPIGDFSHVLDRLTMGIVIAGLIIGSSIIYFSAAEPRLFGVPVLGFVGFLVAFVMGVRLIIDILREPKRRR